MKISVFVVSYNRENLIEACLAGLGFADEVILVDKSSTDATRTLAAKWVDRIVTVPWSPVPGETFAYALSLCTHEWIIALSDDECLNIPAIDFIQQEVRAPRADVYLLPRRNYVLGRFDSRSWYFPDHVSQMYRKGAFTYDNTIHAAARALSDKRYRVPEESGVAIIHLSHQDVAEWIEKTNRYTSVPDRKRLYLDPGVALAEHAEQGRDLRSFAHHAIDVWLSGAAETGDGYLPRVNLMRAMYDIIDHVKALEERDGIDGRLLFERECETLMREYDSYYRIHGRAPRTLSTSG